MKNILTYLSEQPGKDLPLALATIIRVKGSAPQVQGASAVFSAEGLVAGTLGGGVLEAGAQARAAESLQQGESCLYDFTMEADITSEDGAICGGSVTILIDACRENTRGALREIERSVREHQQGALLTFIGLLPQDKIDIIRYWITDDWTDASAGQPVIMNYKDKIRHSLQDRNCHLIETPDAGVLAHAEKTMLFLQPFFPLPRLVIAGAGHIGQAVAHLGSLLDFEVTVIDDRVEYCNRDRFPDANHLIVGKIEEAVRKDHVSSDTYYVIVTRGHSNDAAALRPCIASKAAYIGMIGSRTKISMMKKQFLSEGWATQAQLDRLHAPIGLAIGSKTVQEIAISIAAQLVTVRQQQNEALGHPHQKARQPVVTAVILAAGASERMGQPKLLLPFNGSTIIETVVSQALRSSASHVLVVLGAHRDKIMKQISGQKVITVDNPDFKDGMLSSVRAGLHNLPPDTGAVMIMLADQPMIHPEVIDQLTDAYRHSPLGIAIAVYEGKRGHPLLFDVKYREEILQLSPEASLHDFLDKHPGETLEVETGTPDILRDIDTNNDYNKELNHRR